MKVKTEKIKKVMMIIKSEYFYDSIILKNMFSNENQENQGNRCKKKYDPTNGFILTSVVWNPNNKSAEIDARLRFKKENVSLFYFSL
jgi:hypothetical protein